MKTVAYRKQHEKLTFPLRVGSSTTGFLIALEGDTGSDLYRWDEEHRLLIISAEQSPVGQHRALLQALLEWTLYHLEGMEVIEHQLIQHEIEEVGNLLLEMLSLSGLYAVGNTTMRNDRKKPQFEYRKEIKRQNTKAATNYAKRGKNWKKHPSMVAGRRQKRYYKVKRNET